ncbi:Synaptobrevin [Pseudolycoriella hygida]|uniref:Synaptobrevin n=1 Tax=Pseudolycoriella hygida TaxID=35572 RepID=A0A9Q0N0P1_9DIPT|nr:Synaptobrevin [Pseudolycoriella hygida]
MPSNEIISSTLSDHKSIKKFFGLLVRNIEMEGPNAGSSSGNFPTLPPPPSSAQQIAAQKRLQQTQAKVDEVVGIMRVNVEKVLERDQKLGELDQRADALQHGASQFEQQAASLLPSGGSSTAPTTEATDKTP